MDRLTSPGTLTSRPRRNRSTKGVRALVREQHAVLDAAHLVWPIFIQEGEGKADPISALQGQFKYSVDRAVEAVTEAHKLGIQAVALFPSIPDELKNSTATEASNPEGLVPRCVRALKAALPDLVVITDVALDPYSSDGHDGILTPDGRIDNDATLPVLAAMAVAQAAAGADVVAPSDMMDGRVDVIRRALDAAGYTNVLICSYTIKYCSAFYGPFRVALDSAPRAGDKKTYQADPANARDALRELQLDEKEGADWVMVKPAVHYMDVIRMFRDNTTLPVVAYHVSGEYAMLCAAAEKGLVDYKRAMVETLMSLRRAGADIIFTYAAAEVARWIRDGEIAL